MDLHLLHLERIQLRHNSFRQDRREPLECRRTFAPPIINVRREYIIDSRILREGNLLAQSRRTGSLGDGCGSLEYRRQYRGRRGSSRVCIGDRYVLVHGNEHTLVIGDRLGIARRTAGWHCSAINLSYIRTLPYVHSVENRFKRSKCG